MNVDFGMHYLGLPTSYGAASGQAGSWNDVVASGTTSNLIQVDGSTSGVSLTLTADEPNGYAASTATTDDQMLLFDNFYSSLDPWSVQLSGLENNTYDVFYYAPSNSGVITGTFTINGTGVASLSGDSAGDLVQGTSWQVLEGVTVSDGTLTIASPTTFGYRGLAGIQLVIPALHWAGGSSYWYIGSNWDQGIAPHMSSDVYIDPAGAVNVTGPFSDTTVAWLYVGAQTSGTADLQLQNNVTLNVNNTTTVSSRGRISGAGFLHAVGGINNYGEIDLGTGNLDLTGGTLTNNGTLRGGGSIDNIVNNTSAGEIRVAAGERMHLTNTGSQTNAGRIEVIGDPGVGGTAEIEVDGNLQNAASTGLIAGRSASMRFDGGLDNAGALALSYGTSDVFGDINNTGAIELSGGAQVTFFDDVIQNGTMVVAAGGGTVSDAVIYGSFSGGGGFTGGGNVFFFGDLRPGNSPAQVTYDGNVFLGSTTQTDIEIGGLAAGTNYDQMIVDGDVTLSGALNVSLIDGFSLGASEEFTILDVTGNLSGQFAGLPEGALVGNFGQDLYISYTGGDGNDVVLTSGAPAALPGDGNLDGWVDGLDYLIWAGAYGTHPGIDFDPTDGDYNNDGWVDGLDYLLWAGQYGTHVGTPVPEPATVMLLVVGCAMLPLRRRR